MRPTERVLLAHPRNGERLARKPSQKHVMIGNVPRWEADNIADQGVFISKVCGVGFLSPRIPFTCEDSSPARSLEPFADSTDPCEKVNKGERTVVGRALTDTLKNLAQRWLHVKRQGDLAVFPARDGFSIHVQSVCKQLLGEMFPDPQLEGPKIPVGMEGVFWVSEKTLFPNYFP